MNFQKQIELSHSIAKTKGLWNGNVDKRDVLLRIIAEIALASIAKRDKNLANMEYYLGDLAGVGFEKSFEKHILNTFEDRLSNHVIMLFDYSARYAMRLDNITGYYSDEITSLQGIKITSIDAYLFSVINTITSLFHSAYQSGAIGEILGKLFYLADIFKIDLDKHIELRFKYELVINSINTKIET